MSNDALPIEVLYHIFELFISNDISFRDFFNCALVCRTWHLVLSSPRLVECAMNKLAEPCCFAAPFNVTHKYFRLANGALHGQLKATSRLGPVLSASYRNGKLNGDFLRYHGNGVIAETAHYSEGVMTGEQRCYDRESNLSILRHYDEEGCLHGLQEDYETTSPGTSTTCTESYNAVHGKREGIYHSVTGVGNYRELSHYRNGQLNGERIRYYAITGQIRSRGTYIDGKREGLVQRYHAGGRLRKQCFYCGGQLEGEYLVWYHSGYLAVLRYYRGGRKHGEERSWHDGGALSSVSNFVNGKEQGEYKEYWSSGNLSLRCYYEAGERHGLTEHWGGDGVPITKCHHKNGKRDGEYLEYEGGRLVERSHYRDDRLHGLFEVWDSNGELFSHCYYYEGVLERAAFAEIGLQEP